VEKGLVENYDGRLIAPDPELLHNTLFSQRSPAPFDRPVALRPHLRRQPLSPPD
jgi:hypothetical protein